MKLTTCSHAQERIEGACFKLIEGKLMMVYWCDKCNGEFVRSLTRWEKNHAKELGLIK